VGDARHLPAPAARRSAGRWPRTHAGRGTHQPPPTAARVNEPTPTGTLDAKAVVAVVAVEGVDAASTEVEPTKKRAEVADEAVAAVSYDRIVRAEAVSAAWPGVCRARRVYSQCPVTAHTHAPPW